MKRKSFTIVVLVIIALILGVIIVDFLNKRPDRRGANPYALEVDQYREVDPELIAYEEVKHFDLGLMIAADMSYFQRKLYVAGNSSLVVIPLDGGSPDMFAIEARATCLEVDQQHVFVGYEDHIRKYAHDGQLLQEWEALGERTVITNLAIKGDKVFVADAGNRRIVVYDREGQVQMEFQGKRDSEAGHGFILASANFDLAVNSFGELWVVNTGRHALENYSDEGRLRGYWENSSFEIEGFLGCCNPARITTLEDGSFVTSEKGMVRIKIYHPSGELRSVVAPPNLFKKKEEGKAPEVCADEDDIIYALDFDQSLVRVFKPKS